MRQELRGLWSDTLGGPGAGRGGSRASPLPPCCRGRLAPGGRRGPVPLAVVSSTQAPLGAPGPPHTVRSHRQPVHSFRRSQGPGLGEGVCSHQPLGFSQTQNLRIILLISEVCCPQRTAPLRQGLEGGKRCRRRGKGESWYLEFYIVLFVTLSFGFLIIKKL